MADSTDVTELRNKIAEITTSAKYKNLSASHRDAPQQREMDRMKLQLEGFRARLQAVETTKLPVGRRPVGSAVVDRSGDRPAVMARGKPGTRVTVPDEPKIIPRRGNAFVERRTEPLMTAVSVQLESAASPAAAAAAPVGNSMPTRRARPVGAVSNAKRGDVGPIVTIISEPADAGEVDVISFSDLLE